MNSALSAEEPTSTECTVISGPPASGKTERLVAIVAGLLKSGVPASSIAVFAATPCAAAQLDERIFERTGNQDMRGRVRVPWQICLEILDSASEGDARPPRVLAKDEFALLMEDMKELEGDAKRNREIVKFLLRELTELGDDKSGMIFSEEERKLRRALEERCADRDAMMRHQIAPRAVRALENDPSLAARFAFPYVVVDDYANLCRASQILLDGICSGRIIVAGCPGLSLEAYEPYPYARGLEEIAERHGQDKTDRIELDECYLSKGVNKLSSMFAERSDNLADEFPRRKTSAPRLGKALIKQFLSIQDEIDDVVRFASSLPEASLGQTAVIVPDGRWGFDVLESLAESGTNARLWQNDAPLVPKGADKNLDIAFDLLGIAADRDDACAWRSFFSHSAGFLSLGLWREVVDFSKAEGVGAGRAIQLIAEEGRKTELPHGETIASLGKKGLAAALAISEKTGEQIARAAAREARCDESAVERSWRPEETDTCEGLYRRIRRELLFPAAPEKPAVAIGTASALSGTSWETAFVLGTLDKAYPSAQAVKADETIDHKRLFLARDEKVFYTALTRAAGSLRISFPTRESLEKAEKMRLGIRRIYSTENGRVALLSPSRFLHLEAKEDERRRGKEESHD